jgi:hypothetical protein
LSSWERRQITTSLHGVTAHENNLNFSILLSVIHGRIIGHLNF